ncbi:transposase [Streptomyces sp. TLI_235]|nr:IS5 family transposase [Streptomyces sp. TLI_235]PBC67609.1 transposase [Streptomyces sp. TLI_235]
MARGDLTDAQWAVLEPLLPQGIKAGRPPVHTKRQLTNGIRFRTRTGVPWRDLPERYGPRETVYGLFRRWQRDGAWHRIPRTAPDPSRCEGPDHLGHLRGLHDHPRPPARSRCAQKGDLQVEPPGGVFTGPDDHGLGRSRGGLTTKIHLAVEQAQKLMSLVITAGQRGDSPQFQVVLGRIRVPRLGPGRPRTRPDKVRADKAYGSRANRVYLRRRRIGCTIPRTATRSATARSAAPAAVGHIGSSALVKGTAVRLDAPEVVV